jgi:hypothetical protein
MLYVSSLEARARLAQTGGGWRRTCFGRGRRWQNFITWKWAGPAPAGWIRCRWRTPLRLPPLDLQLPTKQPSLPSPDAAQPPGERLLRRVPPGSRRRELAVEPRRRRPRRGPGRPREGVAGSRPADRPEEVAAGPLREPSPRLGDAPRRADAAGGSPAYFWSFRRARAAAQLISAMWVKACGKFPRNSPVVGSISSE